jgi:hypothetical protein
MENFTAGSQPYNYYLNASVSLCAISYLDIDTISGVVASKLPGLEVVWGPAELKDIFGVSFSRMFIASNQDTNEYFVVIRGTNPVSIETWLKQDFDVSTAVSFNTLPDITNVSDDVVISKGAFNGVSDLLSLTDQNTGLTAVQFLSSVNPRSLYVTGHSLGGTLTPVLFAYLNNVLYGGGYVSNMALWSFAGLTPGGTTFNNYLNSLYNNLFLWRIQNSLDVAPFLFGDENGMKNIYSNFGIDPNLAETLLIDELFNKAAKAGIDYAQAQPGEVMPGILQIGDSWASEASLQHHANPTYMNMVADAFPMAGFPISLPS